MNEVALRRRYNLARQRKICPDCGGTLVWMLLREILTPQEKVEPTRVALKCVSSVQPVLKSGVGKPIQCKYFIDGGDKLADIKGEQLGSALGNPTGMIVDDGKGKVRTTKASARQ